MNNNWVDRDDNVPGYLYLINRVGSDSYKIGLTRNRSKRFSQLQCGCPEPLKFTHTVKVDRMFDSEKHLHNVFASYRTRGEWFKLNRRTVAKVVSEMNKLAGIEQVSRVEQILNRCLLFLNDPQLGQKAIAAALVVAGLGFAFWVPLPKQNQSNQIQQVQVEK